VRILRVFGELFALSEKGENTQYYARAICSVLFLSGKTKASFEFAGEKNE
jgi:hypothetical protein